MVSHRLNSCSCFREGRCPHQRAMERLYLIPQILEGQTRATCELTCLTCREYRRWKDPEPDLQDTQEIRRSNPK